MTIDQAQKTVDNWIHTYGVRYFSELTNMAILTEEVVEVARIMARRYGEQTEKESKEKEELQYKKWKKRRQLVKREGVFKER